MPVVGPKSANACTDSGKKSATTMTPFVWGTADIDLSRLRIKLHLIARDAATFLSLLVTRV
eukprot:2804967-Pleurochrysis_carterae.AAC.1